jgi:copper transport protein
VIALLKNSSSAWRMNAFKRQVLVAFWAAMSAGTAQGHATLLQTDPTAGSRISDAPRTIRLSFDERVERVFNSVSVVDSQGRRVDDGQSQVVGEGDVVEVGLKPLEPGQYVVLWKVNSVDGHQVQGRFGFGFQATAPSEEQVEHPLVPEQESVWKIYTIIVKWFGLAAMAIWLGGMFFLRGITLPLLDASRDVDRHRAIANAVVRFSPEIVWKAALLYLCLEFLSLIGQAVTFTDLPLIHAVAPSALVTVLMATNYGQWWAVRFLAALVLAGLSIWQCRRFAVVQNMPRSDSRRAALLPIASAVLGSLVLLTIPLSGHAHVVPRYTLLAVGCDWAHLAATMIWIGGLIHLSLAVWSADIESANGLEILGDLTRRFSRIARICVAVLLATGIYNAWLHMPNWISFLSTAYGRVLLIKLTLIVPILIIGALNLRRVLPALAGFAKHLDRARTWAGRFQSLIRAESVLAVVLLGVVAVLTTLPPSSAVASGPINIVKRVQDWNVSLRLEPNRLGKNEAIVSFQDASGLPVIDAKRVTLYLQMLDMDMGLVTVQALPSADGTYRAEVPLSMTGKWSINVEVSPHAGDTFVTEFVFSSGS